MNCPAHGTTFSSLHRIAALLVAVALTLLPALSSQAQTQTGGPIHLIKDINQTAVGIASPTNFAAIGNTLYFVQEIEPYGRELWRSDGTTAGTRLVRDIFPGLLDGELSQLTNVGGTLFFQANDSITGVELWKSDGTPEGTVLVKDIFPGITNSFPDVFTAFGNVVYFTADDGSTGMSSGRAMAPRPVRCG